MVEEKDKADKPDDAKASPPYFCPRCDRQYPSWAKLIYHVREQHPDHDPNWYGKYE